MMPHLPKGGSYPEPFQGLQLPLLETVMVLPAVPKTLTEHDMAVPTSFKSHITGRAEKDEQDSSDKPHSTKLTKKKKEREILPPHW